MDVGSCGVIAAEMLLGKHPWYFPSDDWPTVFAFIAAKIGRPPGGKGPLTKGVSQQDMVGGGMWKNEGAAIRPLTEIPKQAQNLTRGMCQWRQQQRIPLINKACFE